MTGHDARPQDRIINSVAPIRVCDNGGWTDTWFAGHGQVFNVAVYPLVEVQVQAFARDRHPGRAPVLIHAENFSDHYAPRLDDTGWDRHPLLEATLREMGIPEDLALEITIFSRAPSGASTGTSAAVTVALIGALDCLTPGRLTPHQVAYLAHTVEVDRLKQQSGIQDQLCSAYGGINYIDMPRYPHATVTQIRLSNALRWELDRRLALIYLGRSHRSSEIHRRVIQELEHGGPVSRVLDKLRLAAVHARDALMAGDFVALGQAMIANTEAQGQLHADLICSDARRVIDIAQAHGAAGWKVNGAGGAGGSVTILCGPLSAAKRAMLREIEEESALYQSIPVRLSRHGLRTWEST